MNYKHKHIADWGVLRDFCGAGLKLTTIYNYRQRSEEERKITPKGEAGNTEKLNNSLSRTKNRIFELALCNPWEWFATLTLSPEKYDRHDLERYRKDLSQFVRDYRKKTGHQVKYLLIPEHHQDGSWHMHGFFMGLPAEELHAFTIDEHLPYYILERIKEGKQVFTWEAYAKKFGFANLEEIRNQEAASKYITKYITKEAMSTITELNAHAFFASKGLQSAVIACKDILTHELESPDYENEYLATKWFANEEYETALSYFEGVMT